MLSYYFFVGLCMSFLARADITKDYDGRLQTAIILNHPTTGASTTPDGRTFLKIARVDGSKGPQIVEVIDNHILTPYPNEEWNSWNADTDTLGDSEHKFVSSNAQRIGPDGKLWVVDSGDLQRFPNSSKLTSFDLETGKVDRVYYLGDVTTTGGSLNDVRFNGNFVYLTEFTIGSIIVLDLKTGDARMVLRGHHSVVASMPLSAEGQLLRDSSTGEFRYIHADQLEVSPDGKYLYYQPGSGYMSRIETKYINEALHNNTMRDLLPNYVEPFALTPSTGGTAIDAKGRIYYSDGDRQEIRVLAPNGTTTLLTRDSRLLWVDALWLDNQQRLWMCASQLNHGDFFLQPDNHTSTIKKPLYVYTIEIDQGPPALDHA